jgi:hypothetical protein
LIFKYRKIQGSDSVGLGLASIPLYLEEESEGAGDAKMCDIYFLVILFLVVYFES